ncbi:MAG: GSCFA domain-containing protein [Saprospiraceae bacterium]
MVSDRDLVTCIEPHDHGSKITYADAITMAGSCFTEHISDKLLRYKYNVLSNPFGILFNPVSIARSFERIVHQEYYHEDELVLHDGLYHSMDHHGSFSGKDKRVVLDKINSSVRDSYQHLAKSKYIFISLGSAKVHRYKKTGVIAGNCHKIPQDAFDSYRLTSAEGITALEKIENSVSLLSADAELIWTVSPVRHLKDGIEENQLSKATLLLAIDHHLQNIKERYFPAYEIMMDQLRDYRYYARDLVHPSALAIDIIWDIFVDTYLESGQKEIHVLIEKIHRAKEHRFLQNDADAIKSFAEKQLKNVEHLASMHPEMNWKEERQYFFGLKEPD